MRQYTAGLRINEVCFSTVWRAASNTPIIDHAKWRSARMCWLSVYRALPTLMDWTPHCAHIPVVSAGKVQVKRGCVEGCNDRFPALLF